MDTLAKHSAPAISEGLAAAGSLLVAVLLSACTGTQTLPPQSPSSPRVSSQAAPTATSTVLNSWAAYFEAANCDPSAPPAVVLPNPVVTASTAVDDCRVLVASPDGLAAVTAAGGFIRLDPLDGLDEAISVAGVGDTIWVSGTTGNSPVLLRFTSGMRSKVTLPPGVDGIGLAVATSAGVVTTAKLGQANVLLRDNGSQTTKIGELPGAPIAFAAADEEFLAAVISASGIDIVFGNGQQWRRQTVGSAVGVDIRGVAVGEGLLIVAANKLVHGVPSGALFLISRDQGRSWVQHQLNDAEVASVAVIGRDIFVAMTRQGNSATIYRSTDAASWTAIPTQTRYESLPNLDASDGTIWLVGLTITRLVAN